MINGNAITAPAPQIRPPRLPALVRWSRLACTLLLCALLGGLSGGCSATRVVYNQLDWIVVWYLNGYFSLDDAQEAQLREAVSRNIDWHRRNQLPKYAEFLRQLDRDSSGVLTEPMLEQRYEVVIELWDEMVRHTLPDVSAFFLALSDEQVDEFIANLDDNNDELWDEYAGDTAEERFERREKAAFKGFKRVIGRLTDEQKDVISAYMANMHDVSEYWIESRRQWQLEFRDLIVTRPPDPEFTERLTALMLDPNRDDDSAYRQKVDENRQTFIAMTVALSEVMTDPQRDRLSKRLQGYARDFEVLAGQQL